jgi:predicted ABC-type ATPase
MPETKTIYIIGGCNGAGKTTASFTILPEIIDCKEFVNADEIARGLSPFQPEAASFEAGRIMLHRIEDLVRQNKTFAYETTLASKIYQKRLLEAKSKGYSVVLFYFWLQNVELAKERVRIRVDEGGHNIDPATIERRYYRSISNLFNVYLPLSNAAMILDNSTGVPELLAEKRGNTALSVENLDGFHELIKLSN